MVDRQCPHGPWVLCPSHPVVINTQHRLCLIVNTLCMTLQFWRIHSHIVVSNDLVRAAAKLAFPAGPTAWSQGVVSHGAKWGLRIVSVFLSPLKEMAVA